MSIKCIPPTGDWLTIAAGVINEGGVVALAFERLFGLAGDALDKNVVARLAGIKDRPGGQSGDKPISVILPDIPHVESVTSQWPPLAEQLARKHWPGPLTLVLPAKEGLPAPLVSKSGTIGFRVPGPSPALELARFTGKILTATSANESGQKEPLRSDGLVHLPNVDLIVMGEVSGPPGSTVAGVSNDQLTIFRQGAISISPDEKK